MDKSFVDAIAALCVAGRERIIPLPGGPEDRCIILDAEGNPALNQKGDVVLMALPEHPRRFDFLSLEDFVSAVQAEGASRPVVVLVRPHLAVALLGADRRERFTFEFDVSPTVKSYADLVDEPEARRPRDMAEYLRETFPTAPPSLIGLLKSVRFEAQEQDEAKVTADSSAISQSVKRKALFGENAELLPEEFELDLPVYGDGGKLAELTTAPLRFFVRIDLTGKQIVLAADGQAYSSARFAAVQAIVAYIREVMASVAGVVVYAGGERKG